MLDLYFQYVVWLNRTLLDGIKWLITNKDAYYVFMCSIPILATIITTMRGQLMVSFNDHKEPTTEQTKEAIDTLGNATEKEREDILKFIESGIEEMTKSGKPKNVNDLEMCKKHLKTLYEHEKLMNHNELMHKIKEEKKPRPIVQYSHILSANEIRRKFENEQRSKSSHRG